MKWLISLFFSFGVAVLMLAPAGAQEVPDTDPSGDQEVPDTDPTGDQEVPDTDSNDAEILADDGVSGTASGRSLTVEEAVELASERNHQVRQAEAGVELSELSVSETRAGRWPTVSVDGRYVNNLALPVIVLPEDSPFGGGSLTTGTQHNYTVSADISVPIYSAQLNRSIELSQAVQELEAELYGATVQEVKVEVRRAYVNGLIARQVLAVLQESHETLQRNLELVQGLYDEGAAPEYDLIRTEVQVRNMEPEIAAARNNFEGALNYVKLLTGIAIPEEIALEGSLEELYESLPDSEFEADFENNQEIIQVEGQETITEHQIAMERATYWPTVSAFGNFTYQGQGDEWMPWEPEWTDTASAGLSVSIPLFTGGRRQRVDQAEVEHRQAQMQREFLAESLQSEFQTTVSRIEELEATIAAQERNIEQAERGYRIARASYEEGVHGLMDVNDAESALTDARLNYESALADYINAVLDLEDLVGESLTTTNER